MVFIDVFLLWRLKLLFPVTTCIMLDLADKNDPDPALFPFVFDGSMMNEVYQIHSGIMY